MRNQAFEKRKQTVLSYQASPVFKGIEAVDFQMKKIKCEEKFTNEKSVKEKSSVTDKLCLLETNNC